MNKLAALAAFLMLPLLSACGFQPLYGNNTAPQLSSIFVEDIAERNGFELRTRLIDILDSDGMQTNKRYRLKITLSDSSQGIALQNDAAITRYNNRMEARFVLSDASGKEIYRGTQSELSSYNVVQSPYATLAAEQDSGKRAVQDMAERIRLELAVWFRRQK